MARGRLGTVATLETERRRGPVAETILDVAEARSVDEIVVGPRAGMAEADAELGRSVRRVLTASSVPVVVIPFELLG